MNNELKIQGQAVILSNFLQKDISDNYLSWLNDSEVVQYSNQRFNNHTFLTATKYFESFIGSNNLFISIKLAKNNQMIGTMTAYFSPHNTVDVGIMIGDKSKWGKGYGKDAWNSLLLWLKNEQNIRKITAGTVAINTGMLKLIEASGMKLEAVKKDHEIVNNNVVDILYFSKFNEKYK